MFFGFGYTWVMSFVCKIMWGFNGYLAFYFIRGFGFLGFCGYIIVMAFRDGCVIITSVGFDRVRTLQLAFISFALLLPV